MENLVKKALFLYTTTLKDREELRREALEKINKAVKSAFWQKFVKELSSATLLFREIEGFLGTKECFIRPDLLVLKGDEVQLWEFKLRESDFKEEQVSLYREFLAQLFPRKKKRFFLLTFEPFAFRILDDGTPGLFNTTQLSLFKNLS
ncbi:MAG: hypothetical protein ACK4UR_04130 [Caldimicrobium sp.]